MEYQHPNGETILLESDEIIMPGSKFRAPYLGFYNQKTGDTGDLIIQFWVDFPKQLDENRKKVIANVLPVRKKIKSNSITLQKHQIIQYEGSTERKYDEDEDDDDDDYEYSHPAENIACNQQ